MLAAIGRVPEVQADAQKSGRTIISQICRMHRPDRRTPIIEHCCPAGCVRKNGRWRFGAELVQIPADCRRILTMLEIEASDTPRPG